MMRRTALTWMGTAVMAGIGVPVPFAAFAGPPEDRGPAAKAEGGHPVRSLQGYLSEEVYAVAFSPDGSLIATGGEDTSFIPHVDISSLDGSGRPPRITTSGRPPALRVWDVVTGRELWSTTLLASIFAVSFSPDGTRIASGGVESFIAARESIRKNRINYLDPDQLRSLNGARQLFGAAWVGGLVKVWDTATGHEVLTLTGHKSAVGKVAIDRVIASLDIDGVLRLWKSSDGRSIQVIDDLRTEGSLDSFSIPRHLLAVSADATRVMMLGGDRGRQWDVAAGRFRNVSLEGASNPIALSSDGTRFVTGSQGQAILLWDFKTLELLRRFPIEAGEKTGIVAFSPDGSRVLSGSKEGRVRLWEAATGHHLGEALGPKGHMRAVAFLPGGGLRVASGGWERLNEIDPETNVPKVEPLWVWDAPLH